MGNRVTITTRDDRDVQKTNPFPVLFVRENGSVVLIRQVEENRLGSECSGSTGDADRILTLVNTSQSGGPVSLWVESQLITQTTMTAGHLPANSIITIGVNIYDADKLRVFYYD